MKTRAHSDLNKAIASGRWKPWSSIRHGRIIKLYASFDYSDMEMRIAAHAMNHPQWVQAHSPTGRTTKNEPQPYFRLTNCR